MRRSFVWMLMLALVSAAAGFAQAPAGEAPKLKVVREIDNPRVTVLRLTMPAGYRDPVTSGPNDLVVTQASPGDVEVVIGTEKTTAKRHVGQSWFVPKGTPHAFSNAGPTSFEILVTVLK